MLLAEEIAKIKREKNAVILAHYYVRPEVQDVADYVGDSFGLAKLAASLDCDTIVFCGVRFMGESAKLLNPEKTVLLPEPKADCPMAHMTSRALVDECRSHYGDDLAVVCYVNSTVEVKAMSDVCVTSSNALHIVAKLPQRHILFIPDRHLGAHIGSQLPEKHVIVGEGSCPVHDAIDVAEIAALKEAHPNALVLAHPECNEQVRDAADVLGSTSHLIEKAATCADASEFIIATAVGVRHQMALQAVDAGRRFLFPETLPVCADMAAVTLKKVHDCLVNGTGEVHVEDALADRARLPLQRMLEMAAAK